MRRYQQLSQEERYSIAALGESRKTLAEMARAIDRSPSTVLRERRRNRCNSDGAYRAAVAESYATARRWRERVGFRHTPQQWERVIFLLKEKWSPEQIAFRLKLLGEFSISHETIYKYIIADRKNGGTLFRHLRCSRKLRRKRHNTRDSRGILPGKRSIAERPPEVETRRELGHWEGDTMVGSDLHHCVLTLVERKSGLVVIKKMSARTTDSVTPAASRAIEAHRANFRTLTLDNGTEFHAYKSLEELFPLKCYFARPYHSWERGSNENTNGLIRQYLPKGTNMKHLTQDQCDLIAFKLNSRPRKRHGYITPQQVYAQGNCTSSLNLRSLYSPAGPSRSRAAWERKRLSHGWRGRGKLFRPTWAREPKILTSVALSNHRIASAVVQRQCPVRDPWSSFSIPWADQPPVRVASRNDFPRGSSGRGSLVSSGHSEEDGRITTGGGGASRYLARRVKAAGHLHLAAAWRWGRSRGLEHGQVRR